MSLFNSNGRLVLLHNALKEVKKASKYDLVLSPQFYIVKREKLAVKYAYQAKKLAPSVMEDLLPGDRGYEYVVRKDGDSWLFYAYRPKEVENFIKGCCGVEASKIGNIYFADQLKPVLEKLPVGIDEYYALSLVDGYATIVPRKMLSSDRYAKFSSKLRPRKAISFKSSSRASKDNGFTKTGIIAASILALLGVAYIVEGYSYKKSADAELSASSELYSKYPQLQSKLTRDSIRSKYQNIEKKQRAIREYIEQLSKLSSRKTLLNNLELNDKAIISKFNVDDTERKKLKSIVSSTKLKITNDSGSLITIEGALK